MGTSYAFSVSRALLCSWVPRLYNYNLEQIFCVLTGKEEGSPNSCAITFVRQRLLCQRIVKLNTAGRSQRSPARPMFSGHNLCKSSVFTFTIFLLSFGISDTPRDLEIFPDKSVPFELRCISHRQGLSVVALE